MADLWASLTCPMPGCAEPLYITWTAVGDLTEGDIAAEAQPLVPADTTSTTWQVECGAGHVVLLPGDPWCGCDDPQGEGCPHGEDEFDWTEENRTFRPGDMIRLATIGGTQ